MNRGRLGRQGGLSHLGLRVEFLRPDLTANKKGGGLSFSQVSFQEPARSLRESPPWARYHDWYFGCAGNLPARTCRSSSTNSKRFSPGVSPSLSRATTSASNIPTIAISTLILWSPCSTSYPGSSRPDLGLAAVASSVSARPRSAPASGAAASRRPRGATPLSLCPLRRAPAVPLPQRWSPGQPTELQSLWPFVAARSSPSPDPSHPLLVSLLPQRPLPLETAPRLHHLQVPL